MTLRIYLARVFSKLNDVFGKEQIVSVSAILIVGAVISLAMLIFMNSATPNSITLASGPKGSSFQTYADKYKKILARQGVTLNIVSTEGSMDNLKKLSDPKSKIDVGFVLGGEVKDTNLSLIHI